MCAAWAGVSKDHARLCRWVSFVLVRVGVWLGEGGESAGVIRGWPGHARPPARPARSYWMIGFYPAAEQFFYYIIVFFQVGAVGAVGAAQQHELRRAFITGVELVRLRPRLPPPFPALPSPPPPTSCTSPSPDHLLLHGFRPGAGVHHARAEHRAGSGQEGRGLRAEGASKGPRRGGAPAPASRHGSRLWLDGRPPGRPSCLGAPPSPPRLTLHPCPSPRVWSGGGRGAELPFQR